MYLQIIEFLVHRTVKFRDQWRLHEQLSTQPQWIPQPTCTRTCTVCTADCRLVVKGNEWAKVQRVVYSTTSFLFSMGSSGCFRYIQIPPAAVYSWQPRAVPANLCNNHSHTCTCTASHPLIGANIQTDIRTFPCVFGCRRRSRDRLGGWRHSCYGLSRAHQVDDRL